MNTTLRSLALLAALILGTTEQAQAEQISQAAGPQQIEPGNILVLNVGGPQRWVIMPHAGPDYHLYVATLSGEKVDVAVHKLPIGGDPDDPDDPPPDKTLADAVDEWADAVNDPDSRAKLAAVYQFTLAAVDAGTITTPVALKAFQLQADKLIIGEENERWVPFFTNVKARLDRLPNEIAAYRTAWSDIASGLGRGTQAVALDPAVTGYLEYLLRVNTATWRP